MSEQETIARLKNLNEPAFICKHLLENRYLNMNFPSDMEEDTEAWCDECEKLLQEEGGWTDRALKLADIKPYCRYCFAELREMHRKRFEKNI